MRWPLRYQFLAPLAIVMLASSAGVSLLDAYLAARSTEQHIQAQLREVACTLLETDFPLTDRVLRQTRGLSGAEFVLTGDSGRVLASSLDAPGELSAPAAAGGWESFRLGPIESVAGDRYFHGVVAMGERGAGPAGSPALGNRLHILYPEKVLGEARWQAIYPPLFVGALTLAVVMVVAVVIAGRLSRPILQLRQQVGKLAGGQYQPVPLPPRDDELRELVVSVNSLADQLEEMRRVVKRAERLTLLGQLSGGLAHHLRNDVTGARLAVQLHQRHCRQIDQESLAVALRQLKITEEQLQKFLAAGQPQPLRRIACALEDVFDSLAPLVEPACRHRKAHFEIRRAGGPADAADGAERTDALARGGLADRPATLRADPEQLRQLLLNLALNAIDAAGPGGWVRIEYDLRPRQARVRVLDSGPGPPPELVDRLFEAFATSKPEGVGLGLAVARQIAAAHGGELVFRRDPHTCFELTLPRSPEDDEAGVDSASLNMELAMDRGSP